MIGQTTTLCMLEGGFSWTCRFGVSHRIVRRPLHHMSSGDCFNDQRPFMAKGEPEGEDAEILDLTSLTAVQQRVRDLIVDTSTRGRSMRMPSSKQNLRVNKAGQK